MSRHKMSTESLNVLIRQLELMEQHTNGLMAGVNTEANGITSTWTGAASIQFLQLHQKWNVEAAKVLQGVQATKSMAKRALRSYESSAGKVKAIWK